MHIFQHLKTYDKPANKDRQDEQNEPKKETDSWFDSFKGCLYAIILFIGSIVLLYGICDAINSSEFGMNILLIVGGLFVIGLVAFYLGTPVFLIIWEFLGKIVGNRYLKLILGIMITILIVGFLLYTCGAAGDGGTGIYEPGKLRPDKF